MGRQSPRFLKGFVELEPLEARNVGMIKAWKLSLASRYTSPPEISEGAALPTS